MITWVQLLEARFCTRFAGFRFVIALRCAICIAPNTERRVDVPWPHKVKHVNSIRAEGNTSKTAGGAI